MPRSIVRVACAAAAIVAVVLLVGRRRAAADSPGSNDPPLRTARTHPIRYYVTLPDGWTPDRRWPVLVTLEGSGRAYAANHAAFVSARGARPYIIVTPQIVSNRGGNRDRGLYPASVWAEVDRRGTTTFDTAGVFAVLQDVVRDLGGEEKPYLTGFSSGGHLGWALVFTRPDAFRAAVMASPNFSWRGVTRVSTAPERTTLPVHVFTASRETYIKYIDEQWKKASAALAEHGFAPARRTVIDDAHHDRRAHRVLEFFDSVRVSR